MRLRVTAPIRPTELPERVEAAVRSLFDGDVTFSADALLLQGDSLERLRTRIWELRIIDTVRGTLLAGVGDGHLRFRLSKQAAAGGRVALPVGKHALGDLEVYVEDEAPEEVVWWLCPPTADGEILTDPQAIHDYRHGSGTDDQTS